MNFGKSYIKSFNHSEIDDLGLVKETAKEKQAKALIKIYQAITTYMKELRDLQKDLRLACVQTGVNLALLGQTFLSSPRPYCP